MKLDESRIVDFEHAEDALPFIGKRVMVSDDTSYFKQKIMEDACICCSAILAEVNPTTQYPFKTVGGIRWRYIYPLGDLPKPKKDPPLNRMLEEQGRRDGGVLGNLESHEVAPQLVPALAEQATEKEGRTEEAMKMNKSEVIWNPDDERVKELVGKKVWAFDSHSDTDMPSIGTLKGVDPDDSCYPFNIKPIEYNEVYRFRFIAPYHEPTYSERQDEWIADNGVQVGTKVRITRKAGDYEYGWGTIWGPSMDDFVGKIGEVREIGYNIGLQLKFESTSFWLPYFVLEVVKETNYVPFDLDEEMDRNMLRGAWVKKIDGYAESMIVEICPKVKMVIAENAITTDRLLEEFTFLDGSPCGKVA